MSARRQQLLQLDDELCRKIVEADESGTLQEYESLIQQKVTVEMELTYGEPLRERTLG